MAFRVTLILTGGVACYKSADLARLLRKEGAEVTCVMTRGARRFVTPLLMGALTERPVYTELFSLKDEREMGHIRLARESDCILAAPATADFIAKAAHGLADDLASTVLLAAGGRTPLFFAPAMNPLMYAHPAVQRNIRQLKDDGARFLGPAYGATACGETGEGRMNEPAEIAAALTASFPEAFATRLVP